MKEYLERALRQKVEITEADLLKEKLPLAYQGRYIFYHVYTNGLAWMAICPKTSVGLVTMRKDRERIEHISGLNCALFLESTTFYIREKMMEEGIPFVIQGKYVYLPFIGLLLPGGKERDIAPVHLISYLTQKMVLMALYERWDKITVTKAAEKLNVSKMSASRCFDEIEYLNIAVLGMEGKSRVVTVPADVRHLWDNIQHILRNPVVARYELREDARLSIKGGISALCEYTLLSDNDYPTYGITKKDITSSGIRNMDQARTGEEKGCVVLELGYYIAFGDKGVQDPLSVSLSLTDKEKQDERVIMAIKEMLEENVW